MTPPAVAPPLALDLAPLNRVPRVTFDFWLIKLMAVTLGETAACCRNTANSAASALAPSSPAPPPAPPSSSSWHLCP